MPRLSIEGAELLWGESRGVRLAYLGGDDEAVVLASRNECPSPDLLASDTGELEGWSLGAPPHPTSYNVYLRALTRLNSGGHVALKGTQMLRQNYSRVPWERPFYDQKLPLITGDPLPDVNKDSRLTRPVSIRAEAVTVAGVLGYPAGGYWLSYAGIVGAPTTSPFLTSAAPPIRVTLSQGQIIAVSIPDIPEAWTGIALLLSPQGGSADDLRIQRRIDLRGRAPEEIILSGPYHEGGRRLLAGGRPGARNTTYIAAENQYPAPSVAWAPSNLNTWQLDTRLSYRFLTPRGQTASQRERPFRVTTLQRGKALTWRPVNPPAGASRWIPEFLGSDGKWYTLQSAERGYPLSRAARIHTNQPSSESYRDESSGQFTSDASAQWKKQGDAPVELARQYEDESGIEHPTSPLDEPEIRTPENAGSLLAPGRYQVRTTNVADEEESAPSDPATVTLRDSGIARGQAASGVTDQAIRVYRPPSQEIANARFLETDPRTGRPDLTWINPDPPPPNLSVEFGEGYLYADDTSQLAAVADVISTRVLLSSSPSGVFTLKMDVEMLRRAGGRLTIVAFFYDESGASLGAPKGLASFDSSQKRTVRIGPPGSASQVRYPAEAVTMLILWRNTGHPGVFGESYGARDLAWRCSNIGLFAGVSASHKRIPLGLELEAPSASRVPVPAAESPERPHLPGAYCRVVENPSDGAEHLTPDTLEMEDFEGEFVAGWELDASGATGEMDTQNALQGERGLRISKEAASAGFRYYRHKSFYDSSRDSLAISGWFRLDDLSEGPKEEGTGALLTISRSETYTDYLARVGIDLAGQLYVNARNGSGTERVIVTRGVHPTDTFRLELVCEGANSLDGRASLILHRNGERVPGTELTSLDWRGMEPHRVAYGAGSSAFDSFSMLVDRIHVTPRGEAATGKVPGNYIEYYGPEGTQRHPENFATGMRIPVTAGQTRTVSAYLGTEGAGIGTSLLKTAIKDAAGNVLLENPYLSANLRGDNYWFRAHHTYIVPRGGAYLEFVRNNVGVGLVRTMGLQDEVGGLTQFTNENATDGYLRGRMRLSTPGELPVKALGSTSGWRGRDLVITHEENGDGPLTSHQVLTRTASSERGLNAASWRGALENIPNEEQRNEYAEIEIALYSSDPTLSPALRSAFIDLARPTAVLTRGDGGELPGGAWAFDIQPFVPTREVTQVAYASGAIGVADYSRGESPQALSFSARTFERSSAEEMNNLLGEEVFLEHDSARSRLLLVEGAFEGKHQRAGGYVSWDGEFEAIVLGSEEF